MEFKNLVEGHRHFNSEKNETLNFINTKFLKNTRLILQLCA